MCSAPFPREPHKPSINQSASTLNHTYQECKQEEFQNEACLDKEAIMAWRGKECKNFIWNQGWSTVAQGGGKSDSLFIQPHKWGDFNPLHMIQQYLLEVNITDLFPRRIQETGLIISTQFSEPDSGLIYKESAQVCFYGHWSYTEWRQMIHKCCGFALQTQEG